MNRREIKFRVWDHTENKFMSYRDITGIPSYLARTNGTSFELGDFCFCNDKLVIQQFTNLKDKNGREIYEGDFVSFQKRGGVVSDDKTYVDHIYWEPLFYCWSVGKHYGFSHIIGNTIEVIGNIFENKELLKIEGKSYVK